MSVIYRALHSMHFPNMTSRRIDNPSPPTLVYFEKEIYSLAVERQVNCTNSLDMKLVIRFLNFERQKVDKGSFTICFL